MLINAGGVNVVREDEALGGEDQILFRDGCWLESFLFLGEVAAGSPEIAVEHVVNVIKGIMDNCPQINIGGQGGI